MNDPFNIHEDDISDCRLKNAPSQRWVEDVTPKHIQEFEYLKPSLKKGRFRLALGIFFALLLLLAARSVKLQIVDHRDYQSAAETNRLRFIRLQAPRGEIMDRQEILLTRKVPRFQLTLNPLDLPRNKNARQEILQRVAQATGVPLKDLDSATAIVQLPVSTVAVKTNLSIEDVYPLSIATQDIPGIAIEPILMREYTQGPAFAHLLGYLGKIGQGQENEYLKQGYSLSDSVGKVGLEATFEKQLKGKDGRKYIEVDAAGRVQNILATEQAVSGQSLKLSIDRDLQLETDKILNRELKNFKTTRGAAVVMNPYSGEILALSSLPSFDNNLFTLRTDDRQAIQELFTNPDQPLFDRVLDGTYPPGSTIKLVIASAALQEGIINASTSFLSTGGLRVGQWFFPDWRPGGHGVTNVRHALADSVNTFFYIVGGGYNDFTGLGAETISKYLKKFGFGAKINTALQSVATGFVPNPQWKQESKNEQWYIGDTYHLSIGQGDLTVTPLHIARMTAYFASEGKWVSPHVVIKPLLASPSKGEENNQFLPLSEGELEGVPQGPDISLQNIEIVRQGLRDAVLYGSAHSLSALPITSAGKTGTAQWSSVKNPHAWFTGWAPFNNPEIVVTILIEEGGGGSATASPIARDIMRWWYENRMKQKNTTPNPSS